MMLLLDCCGAAAWIQRLQAWLNLHGQHLFAHGMYVTIQAACGADQPAYGKMFTPFFMRINDPEQLQAWKQEYLALHADTREKLWEWEPVIPRPQCHSMIPALQARLMTEHFPVDTSDFFGAPVKSRPVLLLPNTDEAFSFYIYCLIRSRVQSISQLLSAIPRRVCQSDIDRLLRTLRSPNHGVRILAHKLKTDSHDKPLALLLLNFETDAGSTLPASSGCAAAAAAVAPSGSAATSAASSVASASATSSAFSRGALRMCVHVHFASSASLDDVTCFNWFEHRAEVDANGQVVWEEIAGKAEAAANAAAAAATGAGSGAQSSSQPARPSKLHQIHRYTGGCLGYPLLPWNWRHVRQFGAKAIQQALGKSPDARKAAEIKDYAFLMEWIDGQMEHAHEPRWSAKHFTFATQTEHFRAEIDFGAPRDSSINSPWMRMYLQQNPQAKA